MKTDDVRVDGVYWWNDPDNGTCSGFVKVVSIDEDNGVIKSAQLDENTQDVVGVVEVYAHELEKTFTTVGELMEELKRFDPNMGVELYLSCYDRNNYTSIRKDPWNRKLDNGTKICVCNGGGYGNIVRITQDDTADYLLDDC